MAHLEPMETGNPFRAAYLEGVKKVIEKKQKEADDIRRSFDRELVKDVEGYRGKLAEMFGWPLTERFDSSNSIALGAIVAQSVDETSADKDSAVTTKDVVFEVPKARKEFVSKDGDYTIYRMQLEVMPELWYYGILFVKEDGEKRPFVLAQHGGAGTPELISSFLNGNSGNYNEITNRILAKDVNVFAPQMLLWRTDTYGNEYDRNLLDASLKQCGGSMTGLELYCLMRTLDFFEKESYVDPERMGMVGMSYGGMFTLYLTALDTRIRAAFSCSFFNKHYTPQFLDWSYQNAGCTFMDAEMIMLAKPRKIYVAMGVHDNLFLKEDSVEEFERVKEVCPDWKEWCNLEIFEGVHEFILTDTWIDKVVEELRTYGRS